MKFKKIAVWYQIACVKPAVRESIIRVAEFFFKFWILFNRKIKLLAIFMCNYNYYNNSMKKNLIMSGT